MNKFNIPVLERINFTSIDNYIYYGFFDKIRIINYRRFGIRIGRYDKKYFIRI